MGFYATVLEIPQQLTVAVHIFVDIYLETAYLRRQIALNNMIFGRRREMVTLLVYILVTVAFLFWLSQLIDLLLRDEQHFESHTHRLVWFLVVFVTHIIGAVWYFVWKRQAAKAQEDVVS